MTGIRLHRRAASRAELRPGRAGAPRVQQHPLHPTRAPGARTAAQATRMRRTSAVLGAGGLAAGVVALLPGSSQTPLAAAALRTPDATVAPAGIATTLGVAAPVVITEPRAVSVAGRPFGAAIVPAAPVAPKARRTPPKPLTPQAYAEQLGRARGWDAAQQTCLVALWDRESRWTATANNPSSGAYGIPQALPGYQMADAGADWTTNPMTQVRWGVGYIADRYGDPCDADQHSLDAGWY